MFIIQLTYKVPLAEVDQYLEEHKLFLKKYYAQGVILLSGRKQPRNGGIILAQAENMSGIHNIIGEDPFYRNGIAEYQVTEFLPSMANEAWQTLIQ